ncbi:MAG TPA: serine/threonine-protein kinase, partial [Candidatus Hydrogenedentes bacterium]|nr:serine/threonine-protein kinase [Candidatus Hydrogenedentota bacterium]
MRDIVAQWAADPTRDLPDRLIEANLLAPEEKSLIESFMNEALRARDGDIDRVIESLGGRQFVDASLHSLSAGPREPGSQDVTVKGPQPVYLDERRDKAPGVEETPGRYTGESEYARGGMGRVLLVHDEHLGREVAMKELLPASARQRPPQTPVGQGLEMVSRFLREARVTGQLEHPSIVPVYELGRRRDGTIYYTMKLVRGKTLGDTIRDAKTLQGRMAYLTNFIDLCQAIAYAHSRGVIHRDIKPGNVMIGEFGETVVLDWGLAKSNKERDPELDKMEETLRQLRLGTTLEQKDTTHGHVLGTPTYMPPEQASGQLSEVDERSDVYSLGAVLYELLAGARPFIGSSVGDILNKVIDQEPKPITLYEPDAPPELIAICKKAMSKISKDRYATARELAAEIENFLSGALVGAYQYSLKEQLRRWMRRNKTLVATSALAT